MPLFSVITVTYNNLGGLRRTAQSVLAQDRRDYEWIVVDGDSSDGTVEFLQETQQAAWRSEPDNGIYDAMNKGITRATGDYLVFMNAGDAFAAPDVLSTIVAALNKILASPVQDETIASSVQSTPPDFIYGDALETPEDLASQKVAPHYKKARNCAKWKYGMPTHHQAMIFRREAFAPPLEYDTNYSIAADYKYIIQYIRNSRKTIYIDQPLCIFEAGGISQQRVKQGRQEQHRIRAEMGLSRTRNAVIYMAQTMMFQVRRFLPMLYWRMKR